MLITNVRVGDIIREPGGAKTEVKRIEFNACSSRGVHVNRKECYEYGAHVTLAEKAKIEETAEEPEPEFGWNILDLTEKGLVRV